MLRLEKNNRAKLLSRIKLPTLVLSHQDGIRVARELGYEYIWIDALCIVQDDSHDWARQSMLVPTIYGDADLTIVAGRSRDARDGFLRSTYIPSVGPLALPYQGTGICEISLIRNHNFGPSMNRGWCFQEALLSRRMIVYGEQQLIFKCRERREFEDGHSDKLTAEQDEWYDIAVRTLDVSKDSMLSLFEVPIRPWRIVVPILRSWYILVAEYSWRDFFDPTDIHAALFGVVLLFQKALQTQYNHLHQPDAGRYMAGLWEIDMGSGLLWRSRRILNPSLPALKRPIRQGAVVERAPSWSWMALVGPVHHPETARVKH
jgi:hypothetical protein